MSSDRDYLPPPTAPFAEKLRAAMDRSENYKSQRQLAKALSTDGSLVGKWLTDTIPSRRHLLQLPQLLGTPLDYFSEQPRADRLEELADRVAETMEETGRAHRAVARLQARVRRLEAQLERAQGAATDQADER